MDGDNVMMIPTDIPFPRPRAQRVLGRMAENALFWAVLMLLGIGAVTSFYYEERIAGAPAEQTGQSASVMPDFQGQSREPRILRYQMEDGQLTVYP